jgi:hypothetical protein
MSSTKNHGETSPKVIDEDENEHNNTSTSNSKSEMPSDVICDK